MEQSKSMSAIWVISLICAVYADNPPVVLNIDRNLVLSSVYDAIRANSENSLSNVDPNDGRNKRNINYYGYDDYKNDDFVPSYGEVATPVKQQCKQEIPAVQSISISDHTWSSVGSVAQFLKYLLTIVAVIALPIMLLQLILLPLKVLMGLKSMAFANTLLLGTFLWKYMNKSNRDDKGDDADDGQDTGTNGMSNEVENRFYYPFKTEDLEHMDEGEIKTILKFIKMRNKKW